MDAAKDLTPQKTHAVEGSHRLTIIIITILIKKTCTENYVM